MFLFSYRFPFTILFPGFFAVTAAVDVALLKFKLQRGRLDPHAVVPLCLGVEINVAVDLQRLCTEGGVFQIFGDKQVDKDTIGLYPIFPQEVDSPVQRSDLRALVAGEAEKS